MDNEIKWIRILGIVVFICITLCTILVGCTPAEVEVKIEPPIGIDTVEIEPVVPITIPIASKSDQQTATGGSTNLHLSFGGIGVLAVLVLVLYWQRRRARRVAAIFIDDTSRNCNIKELLRRIQKYTGLTGPDLKYILKRRYKIRK